MRVMELRHLRYFIAVAENGGFGRSARLLHVAQSAISEQVRDLEDELGVALFDREKRRIRLTRYGEQFLEDARAVLASAEKAVANVRKSIRGEIGTVTIGFFVGGTGTFFPSIIKEFRRRFPSVQVSLVEMAPGQQNRALQIGEIDIGFTRSVQPGDAAMLRSEHFQTEPICAVLLRNHPLAGKRNIFIRELANEQFILNDRNYSSATFDKAIALCADAGFSPKLGAMATVGPGVIALVEAGAGVALLPRGSRTLTSDQVVFIPLADQAATIDLVIAWSQQNESPVIHSFLEVARKWRRKPPVGK
jgi:DNA-binding transcriptional LysR family regulator